MLRSLFALLTLVLLTFAPAASQADLFISLIVDDSGKPATTGTGTTAAVAATAAAYWEAAFAGSSVDYSITITIGWAPVAAPAVATGTASLTFPPPAAGPTGSVTLDSDGSTTFWLDPTPSDNSEFATFTETTDDLGGGTMVIGRRYTAPTASGPGAGEVDLLSVIIHEIGHAIHFGADFPTVGDPWDLAVAGDTDIDIDTLGLPHFGAALPLVSGLDHWTAAALGDSNLAAVLGPGRTLLSSADILAIAEVHGFTTVNLDPTPEPSSLALIAVAGAVLFVRRRRRDDEAPEEEVGL